MLLPNIQSVGVQLTWLPWILQYPITHWPRLHNHILKAWGWDDVYTCQSVTSNGSHVHEWDQKHWNHPQSHINLFGCTLLFFNWKGVGSNSPIPNCWNIYLGDICILDPSIKQTKCWEKWFPPEKMVFCVCVFLLFLGHKSSNQIPLSCCEQNGPFCYYHLTPYHGHLHSNSPWAVRHMCLLLWFLWSIWFMMWLPIFWSNLKILIDLCLYICIWLSRCKKIRF